MGCATCFIFYGYRTLACDIFLVRWFPVAGTARTVGVDQYGMPTCYSASTPRTCQRFRTPKSFHLRLVNSLSSLHGGENHRRPLRTRCLESPRAIVKNAVVNTTLALSRNSKTSVETFRVLGNYSAHKITYTCKREYIKEKIDEYRALIDELLHKAGLRT